MPRLAYVARNLAGEEVEGRLRARDENDLRLMLSRKGLELLTLRDTTPAATPDVDEPARTAPAFQGIGGRVKDASLRTVTGQLAVMLEAGESIVNSLTALSEESNDRRLCRVLEQVRDDVTGGSTLSGALERHPRVFNSFYVSSVKVGESSGALPNVFARMEAHMERRAEFRSTILTALIYPTVLTVLATVAVAFMIFFVLPKFIAIFNQNKVELPTPTLILLTIVDFLQGNWHLLLGGFIVCAIILYWQISARRGMSLIDDVMLRLPVIGQLIMDINAAIVLRTFGTLLEAGVPMMETLHVALSSCGNRAFRRAVKDVQTGVMQGEGFAPSFVRSHLFPPSVRQLVRTGETTGTLPLVMTRSAEYLEKSSVKRLARISALFEPVIIIIMGIVVGFIAIATLMPLFGLATALRQGG